MVYIDVSKPPLASLLTLPCPCANRIILILPGLVAGVAMSWISRKVPHALALPGAMVLTPLVFYVVMFLGTQTHLHIYIVWCHLIVSNSLLSVNACRAIDVTSF